MFGGILLHFIDIRRDDSLHSREGRFIYVSAVMSRSELVVIASKVAALYENLFVYCCRTCETYVASAFIVTRALLRLCRILTVNFYLSR